MKKKDIIKHLPSLKNLKREATLKSKEAAKLMREADRAQEIVTALDGVVLHDNFPIRILKDTRGTEVRSGCDETTRSAYVRETSQGKFGVRAYRNEGSESEGSSLGLEFSRAQALKVAKNFVASGNKGSDRGRKRS